MKTAEEAVGMFFPPVEKPPDQELKKHHELLDESLERYSSAANTALFDERVQMWARYLVAQVVTQAKPMAMMASVIGPEAAAYQFTMAMLQNMNALALQCIMTGLAMNDGNIESMSFQPDDQD